MTTNRSEDLGYDADDILDMDDDDLEFAAGQAGLELHEFLSLFDFQWGSPTEQINPGPWL